MKPDLAFVRQAESFGGRMEHAQKISEQPNGHAEISRVVIQPSGGSGSGRSTQGSENRSIVPDSDSRNTRRISSSLCPRFPVSRLSFLFPENHSRLSILNFTAA